MVQEFDKQFDLSTNVNQGSTTNTNISSALNIPSFQNSETSFPAVPEKVPISANSKAIKKSFLKTGGQSAKKTSPAKPSLMKKLARPKKPAAPKKEEEPLLDEYE